MGGKATHPTADQAFDDISKLRSYLGLRPINSGIKRCLKCNLKFESQDIKTERMCDLCKISAKRHL